MTRATGTPVPRTAFRALTGTFLRRFFDNEITGGTQDLKASFFWLIGFLAAPLALLPVSRMMHYRLVVFVDGPEALRVVSRPDKTLAIVLGMAAAGLLAAVVWNSLMLERRDGLILGALPVRGRQVVAAKLAALAIYVFGVSAAMHAVSSLIFGAVLGDGATFGFHVASPIAHFVSAVGSCAFVFLSVTAAQGVVLAIAGPAGFSRIAPVLHIGLVAGLVIGITGIPAILDGVAAFNQWPDSSPPASRLLLAPPVWFLGLYEWMLGNAEPVYGGLAATAVGALAVVAGLTMASYAIVYRRVMVRAVETPEGHRGTWRISALLEWVTRRLSRVPARRASAQLLFTSIGRVERLRFVLAITMGLVCAWIVPALAVLLADRDAPPAATTTFALSYATLLLVLIGLRIAIALPADLRASWIGPVTDAPKRLLRSGLWRALFLASVVPVTAGFAVLHLSLWGARVSLLHAAVMLAFGALLVEVALWHVDDMPCQRPWRPEHANLRMWWPAYVTAFTTITGTLPELEWLVKDSIPAHLAIGGACLALGLAVRLAHRRPYPAPSSEIELFVEAPSVLKLE